MGTFQMPTLAGEAFAEAYRELSLSRAGESTMKIYSLFIEAFLKEGKSPFSQEEIYPFYLTAIELADASQSGTSPKYWEYLTLVLSDLHEGLDSILASRSK